MWRRVRARVSRRRALAACACACAALLAGCALLRPPAAARSEALFPRAQPAALAHFLADFSNLAAMHPDFESWAVTAEWSNYTSWRYEVAYACGPRCEGLAALTAHSAPLDASPAAPRHGPAPRHRVLAHDVRCTRLPLLPWLPLCEETETESEVVGWAGGARLAERARARCGPLAALLAACPAGPALRARAEHRLRALRAAFPHARDVQIT